MVTRAELKSYLDDLKSRFLKNPNTAGIEQTICGKIDEIIRDCWGIVLRPGLSRFWP